MGTSASRATMVAISAALCAVVWLGVNVAFNYGGHISGLFWTGAQVALPDSLAGHTRRVADPVGFDGQYYHVVAHDPLMLRGFMPYVDNPSLRWRRIGLPGLAAVLAAGSDRYVDFTYVLIEIVFVFLGAFWLSRYAESVGASGLWGLAFLVVPGVAVSLDRMAVDLPLSALTIGLVLYGTAARPGWRVYAILCAAPLVRETGMVLLLAWCLYCALRREWRAASLGAACAAPAVGWWGYVYSRAPVDEARWLSFPLSGIVNRTLEGITDPTSTLWLRAAAAFEELILAGAWLALLLACYLAWKRRTGLIEVTVVLFALFASMLNKTDIWASAYGTGRILSPLLVLLAVLALKERRIVFAFPLLLFLPRIALQYEAQLRGALRGRL